jgi:hypothetical protein
LENICARPIFSKSSVFFCTVGPDWEEWKPLNFVHLNYFSDDNWFPTTTAKSDGGETQNKSKWDDKDDDMRYKNESDKNLFL